MDERTRRVAIAICGRETSHHENKSECKACRAAHYDFDPVTQEDICLDDVPSGCKGLGYEYLAEVALTAADAAP